MKGLRRFLRAQRAVRVEFTQETHVRVLDTPVMDLRLTSVRNTHPAEPGPARHVGERPPRGAL